MSAAGSMKVAVIGAGISGLSVGAALKRAGIEDFALLEEGEAIGGTWRDNTYPGCACDIPSLLYSFSFAPNAGWSRYFAEQGEIQRYICDVAERDGLIEHVRTGTRVEGAAWDADARRWRLETNGGLVEAQFLVVGAGPWHEPVIPDLPGLSEFGGAIFHSSRWDHELDLSGKRVAVIGSGASAVQFVPEIQPEVEHLTLFQRTPHWVLPKPDRRVSRAERRVLARLPSVGRLLRRALFEALEVFNAANHHDRVMRQLQRLGELNIRLAVRDPKLRAALTPDYRLGCKRVLMSNDWYPSLVCDNVSVVPSAVASVDADSVTDQLGERHPVDEIILATGFHILDMPVAGLVRGRDGRTLSEAWDGSPRGYLGTHVHGFPNAFLMLGPNAGINTAAFVISELQADHIERTIGAADRESIDAVDVRADVQDEYNAGIDAGLVGKVWSAGNCASYFVDRNGRNSFHFPGSARSLRRLLEGDDLGNYKVEPAVRAEAAVGR